MSFNQFFVKEMHKEIEKQDKLAQFKTTINWEKFRPIIAKAYRDNKETGGRPHTDELVIIRALVIQAIYNLSDPELEFQCRDRISFRNFLGIPENVPDFTTIWSARERLKETGADKLVWAELQRQLDRKGFTIRKGVIQDATFIEADPGKVRESAKDQNQKKREESSHMDKDGTWAVRNDQVHFGYKTHARIDVDNNFVRSFTVTTASLHDSQVDLAETGDKAAYRDKAYFGTELSAKIRNMTMDRATRGHELTERQKRRNTRIARIRSPGERVFAVTKNIFDGWYTLVKTLPRVRIKEMFRCFAYNLYQLRTVSG